MLEKVGHPDFKPLSTPAQQAIDLLQQILTQNPDPVIAEVGIGIGATSLPLCRLLNHRGTIHFFDFAAKLSELSQDLRGLGFSNFVMHGNGDKPFDSYSWSIGKLLLNAREKGSAQMLDLVYLDGAHVFHHDASSTVMLKEMLKPGGILLFDDYLWMLATSPTMNPALRPKTVDEYGSEQINSPHVKFICDLFMDNDPAFEKVDVGFQEKERRRAYRKLS